MVSPQSHHEGGFVLLLLQKQHSIGSDITLTPLNVSKKQGRDSLFITAEHKLFTHCSVVLVQSVLVSKTL